MTKNAFSYNRFHLWPIIFLIGVFLVPFDNWIFAPSAGWASISPYFFMLSFLLAMLEMPQQTEQFIIWLIKRTTLVILPLMLTSLIAYVLLGFSYKLFLITSVKVFLGVCFLGCLFLFYEIYDGWYKSIAVALICGYSLSVLFGVVQWISLSVGFEANTFFKFISARNYNDRVQFSFTEPSFTSAHIYGVLLPYIFIFISCYDRLLFNYIRVLFALIVLFLTISVITSSSLRLVADSVLILLVLLLILPSRMKLKAILFFFILSLSIAPLLPKSMTDRLTNVFSMSENEVVDISAAVRKFRIDSALNGYSNNPYAVLFGFGFGNSSIAMEEGFDSTYSKLLVSSSEIDNLKTSPDGLTYSLPVKILVEHGLVGLLLIYLILFRKTHKFLYLTFIAISAQFDSYAFYTLWIYIFAVHNNLGRDSNIVDYFKLKTL